MTTIDEKVTTTIPPLHQVTPIVIGIGASAGGLEALQQFFYNMPSNSGLSFVVVQHLSPDYKSLMADILSKHTDMSVYQAENGMTIERDTVYLIPPKKYMTVQNGRLILTEYVPGTLNHPIDIFFSSWRKNGGSTPSWWCFPARARMAPTA